MSKVIVQWSSFVGDLAYASTMSNKISLENCRRKFVTVLNSMCSCLIPLVFQVALVAFWVTNPCRITRKVKQTKMYVCTLEEFILVDIWIHCCASWN